MHTQYRPISFCVSDTHLNTKFKESESPSTSVRVSPIVPAACVRN